MMRIVTVTLNPAIDMTVRLAEPLARGSINLAESVTETPLTGLTMAEHFRDKEKQDVLLFIDTAWVHRV